MKFIRNINENLPYSFIRGAGLIKTIIKWFDVIHYEFDMLDTSIQAKVLRLYATGFVNILKSGDGFLVSLELTELANETLIEDLDRNLNLYDLGKTKADEYLAYYAKYQFKPVKMEIDEKLHTLFNKLPEAATKKVNLSCKMIEE